MRILKAVSIALLVGGLGYGIYSFAKKKFIKVSNSATTRSNAISILIDKLGNEYSVSSFDNMEDAYLMARANGYLSKSETFDYNGKTYITATGKVKK
jgi:hypothetical protein